MRAFRRSVPSSSVLTSLLLIFQEGSVPTEVDPLALELDICRRAHAECIWYGWDDPLSPLLSSPSPPSSNGFNLLSGPNFAHQRYSVYTAVAMQYNVIHMRSRVPSCMLRKKEERAHLTLQPREGGVKGAIQQRTSNNLVHT